MSLITVGDSNIMAADGGDGNLFWVELGGFVIALVGGVVGFLSRGLSWASREGESAGELRVWRANIDAQMRATSAQIAALDTRQMAQFDAVEARREAVNTGLAGRPTREEMRAEMTRMWDALHGDMLRIENKLDRSLQRDQRD